MFGCMNPENARLCSANPDSQIQVSLWPFPTSWRQKGLVPLSFTMRCAPILPFVPDVYVPTCCPFQQSNV